MAKTAQVSEQLGEATQAVIEQYDRYVMHTYVRTPIVLTKGKGSRV